MFPRPIRTAVFLAACATIAWLSVAPTTAMPSVNMWDKVQHAGAYFGLALLGAWAFPARIWRLARLIGERLMVKSPAGGE